MLIARSVTIGSAEIRLLVNPDECEVCRRPRFDCANSPWANHTFIPAYERADNVPSYWLAQPVIDEGEARQHKLIDHHTRLTLVTERPKP